MFKSKNKNYLILFFILVMTILISLVATKINFTVQKNKINNSPLAKIVESITIDEIDELLNKSFILFVGYKNNVSIYNLEKELVTIIKNNELKNKFYYLDFTEFKNDSNKLDELNLKLKLYEKRINNLPALIYFNNGRTYGVLTNSESNQVFDISEAYQLLDVNGLLKND